MAEKERRWKGLRFGGSAISFADGLGPLRFRHNSAASHSYFIHLLQAATPSKRNFSFLRMRNLALA
jgi:hypothetical protein